MDIFHTFYKDSLIFRMAISSLEQQRFSRSLPLLGLANTLHLSEQTRLHLEDDIQKLNHVQTELGEQLDSLARQKNSLSEQLIAARKELERQTNTVLHLTKEKEEMNKEH